MSEGSPESLPPLPAPSASSLAPTLPPRTPSCSPTAPWDRGLMLYMADLSEQELRGFGQLLVEKLRPAPVTRDQLSAASWAEVVHLLVERFPGRRAWDVAHDIFTKMDQKKMCLLVQEELAGILPSLGPKDTSPGEARMNLEKEESDQIRAYKLRVTEKYSPVWDKTVWPGNQVDFLYREAHEHQRLLPSLFLPRKPQCAPPTTVVIQGTPGIGKTTLAKQVMLAWARGTFYPHKTWYAFYIRCQEVIQVPKQSCLELIERQLPGSPALVSKILSKPDQLLLLFDGFEELTPTLLQEPDALSGDWKKPLPGPALLSSLLSKTMLPGASLLVAVRPASWCAVSHLLRCPFVVSLTGFDRAETIEYFRTYFGHTKKGEEAVSFATENTALLSLCQVPVVCWLACCGLSLQGTQRRTFTQTCPNATSVLALCLSTLFPDTAKGLPSRTAPGPLESLCHLAARGMWDMKYVFNRADLARARMDETSFTALLSANILRRVDGQDDHYVFVLFIFQELFAAFYYVLFFPQRLKNYHVLASVDVQSLLSGPADGWHFLACMGLFLFGLLNSACVSEVEHAFQHKVTLGNRVKVLKVLAKLYQGPSPLPSRGLQQLFHCLSEAGEEAFVSRALRGLRKATLMLDSDQDLQAYAFCLKHCRHLKQMGLTASATLGKALQSRPGDSLALAGLTARDRRRCWWGDICSMFGSSEGLEALTMTDMTVAPPFVALLAAALRHPQCHLRSLSLESCVIPAGEWILLARELQGNAHLQTLLLRGGLLELSEAGFVLGPLRRLALDSCGLTELSCQGLAFCLRNSETLTHLSLAGNALKDEGARHIWAALEHAACPLRRLVLRRCSLTSACCPDAASALRSSSALRSLDLGLNSLGDAGVSLLCEAGGGLRVLELERCLLTSEGCRAVASLLDASGELRYLDVRGNDVGERGRLALVSGHQRAAHVVLERKVSGRLDAQARLVGPAADQGRLRIVHDWELPEARPRPRA